MFASPPDRLLHQAHGHPGRDGQEIARRQVEFGNGIALNRSGFAGGSNS